MTASVRDYNDTTINKENREQIQGTQRLGLASCLCHTSSSVYAIKQRKLVYKKAGTFHYAKMDEFTLWVLIDCYPSANNLL